MFVDLDWLLNASRWLSASAELLVFTHATLCGSASSAVVTCLSCHTPVLYRNGYQTFSRPCCSTTMVFLCHIWLQNSNGKGSLTLGWTWIFSVWQRLTVAVLESKRLLTVIVIVVRWKPCNYFTPTTYGSRGTAHAHCSFAIFDWKFMSETVRDRLVVAMER